MRLLRRLILPALLATLFTGPVAWLVFGLPGRFHLSDWLVWSDLSMLAPFIAVGLLAIVLPLGLLLSQNSMPLLIKIGLVILGSAIAGYLIVVLPFGLMGVRNVDLIGLFGLLPATVTATIWCLFNTDFLRGRASRSGPIIA
jgi:hypothetical protein